MEPFENFYEILKYIIGLGFPAALFSGLLSCAYIVFCLLTDYIIDINYVYVILISGALIGYGVQQGILDLNNPKTNNPKNIRRRQQTLQENLDILWNNVRLGRLDPSRATQITDEALTRLFFSDLETESTNILDSREQKQISQSLEEE